VLTEDEAEQILAQPDTSDAIGLRDRAILEVLYSTGIRRMEVMGLSVWDLDGERGTLMVRQGKGKKDRMVPIGVRAITWVEAYQSDARPGLVVPPDSGTLFLTTMGEPLTPNRLTQLVRNYVKAAEVGKVGACHLFRHTMATLMLENGADIRFIQEMLGHVELSTTQIYTQVSIRKLKEIHTATHPGAKLDIPAGKRARRPEPADEVVSESELLDALEDEAAEEAHEGTADAEAREGTDDAESHAGSTASPGR
jgi:integrase/recombinase XerD